MQVRGWLMALAALAAWSAAAAAAQESPSAELHQGLEQAEEILDGGHGDDHAASHGDDHAAGHGAGHGAADANPLDFKTDLALWTGVVFAVLLAVLWKFAWGPIADGLDRREHGIAAQIDDAKRMNLEARDLLSQYEQKLAAAQDQVRSIIEEARRDAEHTQQQILAKAQDDAAGIRNRALAEIETATAQALKELAERSTNLAVELAGRIVRAQLSPQDHAQLIAESLSKFPDRISQN